MNIIEVSKKENIGKVYEIFIDGENKGRWGIEEVGKDDFDFFNEEDQLGVIYFASQIAKMEFKEVIDWSKVPVDTKVLVSKNGKDWYRRYFTKYVDDMVYCFDSGATSFSVQDDDSDITGWKYAKLYQE